MTNKLTLADIASDISNNELQKEDILIQKRDGRIEEYNPDKMKKVLLWSTNGNQYMVNELLEDISIKIYQKIKIEKLFDDIIETAAQKVSPIQPIWDDVAKNLYIQKIYKDLYKVKRNDYPNYLEVIKKALQYSVYSRDIIESFSEEELEELGDYIVQGRDFNFDYIGIRVFMDKYSMNYSLTKKLELPQHGFMRLAIQGFWREDKEVRMQLIKKRYDDLSLFRFSEATPKWLNSLTEVPMLSSCVLSNMADNTESINLTIGNLGQYSRAGGGLACDVSQLRCSNSSIGKAGKSSGPVPFIKMIESVVSSYNQKSARPGACCVYYNWWMYDSPEITELKDEGGSEDLRARKLQFGIKINRLFLDRCINNEEITLFDSKDTPDLIESYGEEFNKLYIEYENKVGIRKRKMPARELMYLVAKVRFETGNVYIFFDDNVNENTPFKQYVNSSNLCLAGDTKVYTSEGEKELKDIKIGDYVYSKNTDNNVTELKRVANSAMTNPKAKVMKITDTNTGNSIKCTEYHKIWTKNRGYVQAIDIKEDDILDIFECTEVPKIQRKKIKIY